MLWAITILLFFRRILEHDIGNDAQDQCTGNLCDCDLSEAECQTTDTGNQNHRYNKQVLVFIQINTLYHFQSRYSDKSIKRHTNTTHDTRRNRIDKCDKRREEGDQDRSYRSRYDRINRCVLRDCDTSDGLSVSCVWTSAKKCADHRSDSISKQGSVKSRILQQISLNNGRDIFLFRLLQN